MPLSCHGNKLEGYKPLPWLEDNFRTKKFYYWIKSINNIEKLRWVGLSANWARIQTFISEQQTEDG